MSSLLAFRHSAQTRLFWHSEISPRLDLYLIPRGGGARPLRLSWWILDLLWRPRNIKCYGLRQIGRQVRAWNSSRLTGTYLI